MKLFAVGVFIALWPGGGLCYTQAPSLLRVHARLASSPLRDPPLISPSGRRRIPPLRLAAAADGVQDKGAQASSHPPRDLALKGTIMSALVLQSAGVSLLAQHTCRSVSYSGAAVSLIQEIAKLPIAVLFICAAGRGGSLGTVLRRAYLRPVELLQLCIPASCFAAQNVLFFVAMDRISATTYLVLTQTKALFTAVFTVILLPGKRLRARQWLAQPVLAAGAALVLFPQVSQQPSTAAAASLSRFFVGVNAAVSSAVISGFANASSAPLRASH